MSRTLSPMITRIFNLFAWLALCALFGFILFGFLTGCSTVPQPAPLYIVADGTRHVNLPVPISTLDVGDLVAYRNAGTLYFGRIMSRRGPDVFRVEGPHLQLVSDSNYVGKLVAPKP